MPEESHCNPYLYQREGEAGRGGGYYRAPTRLLFAQLASGGSELLRQRAHVAELDPAGRGLVAGPGVDSPGVRGGVMLGHWGGVMQATCTTHGIRVEGAICRSRFLSSGSLTETLA